MTTNDNKLEKFEADFGGEKITFEFGKLAGLATGAVTARWGDTIVLATVCIANEVREGVDYFPLMVDYEERLYASGKIKGSRFVKRDGRPTDQAVLTSRLIDRPLRPLFPKLYRKDVQIIVTVLSADLEHDSDIVAINAASAALLRTHAPYEGPVAGCRIGMEMKRNEEGDEKREDKEDKDADGKFIFNPTAAELAESPLDIVVVYKGEEVMMIEAGAKEVDEKTVLEAIKFGAEKIKPILEIQKKMQADAKEKVAENEESPLEKAYHEINQFLGGKLSPLMSEMKKEERELKLAEFEAEVLRNFEGNYKQIDLKTAFGKLVEIEVRKAILEKQIRPDGRKIDEIRPISIEVGLLPRTHGSGLFTRGQTQALTVATLGSPGDEQTIETMDEDGTKRYMHHYNFPPFSTGEVSPMRGTSRREIGHGALAERALEPVLPSKEDFPYTIRLVSEILSSNGSSSMAATCGSTLALLDAGVPISSPVTGVAMGLVTQAEDKNKDYIILTDIQGLEDFSGDMDFKIAGTEKGITAIQLDMKVKGITMEMIEKTFSQGRVARLEIMEKVKKVIPESRKEMSPYAPRIITTKINPKKIGDLIGPGGKNINGIIDECGTKAVTQIDIEEDGTVLITSTNAELGKKALSLVEESMKEIEVGQIYDGKLVNIQRDRMTGKEIGAIVQLTPKVDGMVHISEIADHRVEKIEDELKIGQMVKVKCVSVDAERGRIGLSIKQAAQ